MIHSQYGEKYKIAKAEADKVDQEIIMALQNGHSFCVEAGAGSGKTYSLNRVIEWIQSNKWTVYKQRKQNVVCVTFTNAAVDVISERLAKDSFIIPSTIHSFAWNAIKQYQNLLIDIISSDPKYRADEGDFYTINEVTYDLGHRYKENGVYHLYHDDVLSLFCTLLDNVKFRHMFADKYPLILIDEYQDTYGPIIDSFIKYFIEYRTGPQFGFFGDAWQTIYQSNKACGAIKHRNLCEIKKGSNFRSAPNIVKLLNGIRPDLPQISAIDDYQGEVIAITCEDYSGCRRSDRNFKDDIPSAELKTRIAKLTEIIQQESSPEETLKVLMITHKVLAQQQGYEKLLEILNDGLRNKEDPFFIFFMEIVEPVFHALTDSNMQLLFDTLDLKRYPITRKVEKQQWKNLQNLLTEARNKRAIDVYEVVLQSKLIPIPPKLVGWYQLYLNAPDTLYSAQTSIRSFLQLDYIEFLSAFEFLYPKSLFSTEHGVKGEEYDNIIFVIGRGWNLYQFDKYVPMIVDRNPIPTEKTASYERNRNLFYVCCSRPKKRLVFFVSIPVEEEFRVCLVNLVGKENYYTYSEFLKKAMNKESL